MTDLEGSISWSGCEVLNATKSNSDCINSLLKQGYRDQEEMVVESDADEQLLIAIAFSSKVKVHSICINAPSDGRAPKQLKLFVNKQSMDCSDAESRNADQEIELTPQLIGQRVELKFVKFQVRRNMREDEIVTFFPCVAFRQTHTVSSLIAQNVNTLTLFVGSNQVSIASRGFHRQF